MGNVLAFCLGMLVTYYFAAALSHGVYSLNINFPSFGVDGQIPKKHTGFGEDISPAFSIEGLCGEVKTLAVMMDDLDVPFVGELNHWLVWNLPPQSMIPENIPYGAECPNGAVFFLVQSILTVIPEGNPNWYLPLALGLNCIALFLNGAQRRKQKKEDERKA